MPCSLFFCARQIVPNASNNIEGICTVNAQEHAMPWFESSEEATRHAIQASGKPLKAVAAALWPDKSPTRAYTDLANALNENRSERLTADQHIFIANHCGQFDWLYFAADQCCHSRPHAIAKEDREARLKQEFIDAVKHLKHIQAQLGH
ncbi:MAG: hypothetical protein NXI11_13430 [Proteobacteria bacterium]|nr:hypothetical protein [Pseudomonadota bacterium]